MVYDSDLTLSLPVILSVASGLNGMAHCIDSLWGHGPTRSTCCSSWRKASVLWLKKVSKDRGKTHAVPTAGTKLYGAYLAAVSFASAGSEDLLQAICTVLGGTFNLPHAQTHATVLPYVLAFQATSTSNCVAEQRMATAFGSATALEGLQNLRTQLEAPTALQDYGFSADGIAEAVGNSRCQPCQPITLDR